MKNDGIKVGKRLKFVSIRGEITVLVRAVCVLKTTEAFRNLKTLSGKDSKLEFLYIKANFAKTYPKNSVFVNIFLVFFPIWGMIRQKGYGVELN